VVDNKHPVNVEYETRAKRLLKAALKQRGVTYPELAKRLTEIGVRENAHNLANKISRGGFTAAFLLECLAVIGVRMVHLGGD
jgi:hypothetical protein